MSKKTVLLYRPKTEKKNSPPRDPPLALLAISGLLLKKNYKIEIFDAMIDEEAQEKVLKNLDDSICIGFSVWVGYAIKDSLELCRKIKNVRPDFPIVWGGWHPSLFPEQTVADPNVDIVVKGQGETTFFELVKCLEANEPLKNVEGITYKVNGGIVSNKDRSRTSLDELPPVPYHLIDVEKYLVRHACGDRTIGYISSQGCPFSCTFCCDAKLYQRKRIDLSAERVLADLKNLIENYRINGVIFDDTDFFINKEKVKRICQGIINNQWGLKWCAEVRSDQVANFDDNFLKLLKKSGCELLCIGAESGSQKVLDLLNKQISVEQTVNAVEVCDKYDTGVGLQMMIGTPYEDEEDFKKNLLLIKKVYSINPKNHITIHYFVPLPGTPIFDEVVEKYGFRPPGTLEEWSEFDPINTEIKWFDKKTFKERLETFMFYLQFAYPNEHFKKKTENKKRLKPLIQLMHKTALFRFNHDFFEFLIERKIHKIYKKLSSLLK